RQPRRGCFRRRCRTRRVWDASRRTRAPGRRAPLQRRAAPATSDGRCRALDDLGLGYLTSVGKASRVQHAERGILALTEYGLGNDAPDRRREHKTAAAEAGCHPDVVPDSAEDCLVVRSNVVNPGYERRQRDEHELREQLFDGVAHVRPPIGLIRLGIAERAEVARKDTTVGELLRRERSFRRHDEWLEQPLANRAAEEEIARLR